MVSFPESPEKPRVHIPFASGPFIGAAQVKRFAVVAEGKPVALRGAAPAFDPYLVPFHEGNLQTAADADHKQYPPLSFQ
jgi:hypothetical protein